MTTRNPVLNAIFFAALQRKLIQHHHWVRRVTAGAGNQRGDAGFTVARLDRFRSAVRALSNIAVIAVPGEACQLVVALHTDMSTWTNSLRYSWPPQCMLVYWNPQFRMHPVRGKG